MNIKQIIFFLSLLALYLSMVHGQTGQISQSYTEKIEQKYSEEIKQYQNTLIDLDAQLRKYSMTKKYKAIPVQRIVQLLESVSTYEKHILNESFFSVRKFLKKNRQMIRNILNEEEIIGQQDVHSIYIKTETSFKKIFDSYKAHKKAFSSRGLMYYSGIKKIKEIKKILLTQAFDEEKLGFTGIVEKIHYRYVYKPTNFLIRNPYYIALPFLAWGAYKMMYPPQEAKGNSMPDGRGNSYQAPPQDRKSNFSGPASSQQKPVKIHDLDHITKNSSLMSDCLSQSGAECGLYATFHTFSLLINDEEKKHMLEEALIGLEGYHAVALQAVLNTKSSLRDRYEAYKTHYLWWVEQPGNKVQTDLVAKNAQKEKLEAEIEAEIGRIQGFEKEITEQRSTLAATADFWSSWFGTIEDTQSIKKLLVESQKLKIEFEKLQTTLNPLKNDIAKILSNDMTGNNIASDTLEAFFQYFFNIKEEKEEKEERQQCLTSTNYASHYNFHDGELFFIDSGSNVYARMLQGQTIDNCENFAHAIKEFFEKDNPKPLYIIITTGSAKSVSARAGHFTSGKISKVENKVTLRCTNSSGKSTSTLEAFYEEMKIAYEKGIIDIVLNKDAEKRNAITFNENLWGTLACKFVAQTMSWEALSAELENFEKKCLEYYDHEIKIAQHQGSIALKRKQKNELSSSHNFSFYATHEGCDSFVFDITTNDLQSLQKNLTKYTVYLQEGIAANENDLKKIIASLTDFKSSQDIIRIIPFNVGHGTFKKIHLEKKDALLLIKFIDDADANELEEPQTLFQNICYKALLIHTYNQIN